MKIAIMQPYFLPYIGYFSLIKHTDMFILLDTVQFIRHGWIERNRVLKQNGGWIYIRVPLKKQSQDTLIIDSKIDNSQNWKEKIFAQLQIYKKVAPNYFQTIELLEEIFSKEYESITKLNKAVLKTVSDYLEFDKDIYIFSEMNLQIEIPKEADEWALNICKAIKSHKRIHYVNPIGGVEFFDRNKYIENGVDISFQKMKITEYNQRRDNFEAGLSIIDVLMFNSKEEVIGMLDKYELI